MTTCMDPVGGTPFQPGGGHELLSDLNTTKALCSEGKLQQAMSCLEDVYNECVEQNKARSQQSSDLNLMLDVGKWRRGMEKLCDNIDYLMDHSQCTERIAAQSSQCIQEESRQFQKTIASLTQNLQTLNAEERLAARKKIMDEGCSFAVEVIWCFKTPLDNEASCPCRYRQLVIDIVAESMPPYCRIDSEYYYDEEYLEWCEEKEKKEKEMRERAEAELAEKYENDEGGDGEEDTDDVQYGGYSFADPSKVKVFNEGEFVETPLFKGYNNMDHRDSKEKKEKGVQDNPQASDSPGGSVYKAQEHKGEAPSPVSSVWVLAISATTVCVSMYALSW